MIEAYFFQDGRMRRRAFLGYSLLLLPVSALLTVLCVAALDSGRVPKLVAMLISVAVPAFIGWATWALGIKRCHDFDQSGWLFFWLCWLPGAIGSTVTVHDGSLQVTGGVAGLVALVGGLYVLLKPGTDAPNQYGYRD